MIINDISEPQKSLYVIGAEILSFLVSSGTKEIDPVILFEKIYGKTNRVSITYFHFSLDWLYLLNTINLDDSGNIKLCL